MCGAKHRFALMMTALLCLCGCAKSDFTQRIGEKYRDLTEFRANITYTLNSGEYVTAFGMELDYGSEGCRLTVTSPENLAGLVTTVTPGGAEVVYGDRLLVLDEPEGLGVSPVRILPDIIETLKRGIITSYSKDGMCEYYSKLGETELCYRVWFDSLLTPVRAEAYIGSELAAAVEFTYSEE